VRGTFAVLTCLLQIAASLLPRAVDRANNEIKNAAGELLTLILPLLKILTVVSQKSYRITT